MFALCFYGGLGRAEQAGTTYAFGGFRSLENNIFAKFLVSIDREFNADYFGIKIRKTEPVI